MVKCTTCGKFLGTKGVAACSLCDKKYHVSCAHLRESPKAKSKWRCPDCSNRGLLNKPSTSPPPLQKAVDVRGDSFYSPANTLATSEETVVMASQQPVVTPPSNLDIAHEIRLFRNELQKMKNELKSELREIRREITDLRQSVSTCNERVDSLESRIEALEKGHNSVASEDLLCKFEQTVTQLKVDLNNKEQELLSSDLVISSLPENSGENIIHTVELVAKKLGVTLEAHDIVFAERVGPKPGVRGGMDATSSSSQNGRVRRIVVWLARRTLRDELLDSARVRRGATSADLGIAAPSRRFYLNERLTQINQQLSYRARQAADRLGWKYTWTKRGKILTKQGDGKRTFSISSEADLVRVFGGDVAKDNNN